MGLQRPVFCRNFLQQIGQQPRAVAAAILRAAAEQRIQRQEQNFGRLRRAQLDRAADRPGRHQHIPEQAARLVLRGQVLLPVGRISPRLHAARQHDPRMVDPLAHTPDDAVFPKAGRASRELLQQPVQPLRGKIRKKPVLQQDVLFFICQHVLSFSLQLQRSFRMILL